LISTLSNSSSSAHHLSPSAVTDGVTLFTSKSDDLFSVLVIVLKIDDLFSNRHHSHPVRLSKWSFVQYSCKFSRKNI